MKTTAFAIASLALVTLAACSGADENPNVDPPDAGSLPDASPSEDSGFIDFGDVRVPDGGDGGTCQAPDFLIVLDRSASMGNAIGTAPDGGKITKWDVAEDALDGLVASPTDQTLLLGLEVFPDVAGSCGSGTVLVQPKLGQGSSIKSALAATKLLSGTPMGGPLDVAKKTLATTKSPNRKQFVLLVTDGGETCAAAKALPAVQALAKDGVRTFVVGFGAGVNVTELNNLACAGLTAPNKNAGCVQSSAGWAWDGTTADRFFQAQDGVALKKALSSVASNTCCGCTPN